MNKPKYTIDELVGFILDHGGPSLDRRAHPTAKRVKYAHLKQALDYIHVCGELLDVRPYHFHDVLGIWSGEEGKSNARGLTGDLITHLQERYGWSLSDVISNINLDSFKETLSLVTPSGVVEYNTSSMLHSVYHGSPSSAVLDWIANHPDLEIREGYADIRPWHFGKARFGTWKDRKGNLNFNNARELTGVLISYLKNRYHWSLSDVISNIDKESFNKPLELITPSGVIVYNAHTMLGKIYSGSPYDAVLDFLYNHSLPCIRDAYSSVRPWHFKKASNGTWQGEIGFVTARELTGKLITHLQERYGWSLSELISNINQDHFKELLKLKTPSGIIEYNAFSMLANVYGNSPSSAVLDWINNNPLPCVRDAYSSVRPWHFGMAALHTWQGEIGFVTARELTGKLITHLQAKYSLSLSEAVVSLRYEHFEKEILTTSTPSGDLSCTCQSMVVCIYGSYKKALADYLSHHEDPQVQELVSLVK